MELVRALGIHADVENAIAYTGMTLKLTAKWRQLWLPDKQSWGIGTAEVAAAQILGCQKPCHGGWHGY